MKVAHLVILSFAVPCVANQIQQASISGIYQLLYNQIGLRWATVRGSSIASFYSRQTTLANQQLYNASNQSATTYWEALQYARADSSYVLYYDGLMNKYQEYNSCVAILDSSTTVGTLVHSTSVQMQLLCFRPPAPLLSTR